MSLEPDKSIQYKATPQGILFLHIYYPDSCKPTDKRPAILFFFGGGWISGNFKSFSRQARYLASRGIVAFCADYRIRSEHMTDPKVCVSDGKSAVRWIRVNAGGLGVDPGKIIAGGGSAGGHVAAATATITAFDEESDDVSVSPKPQALVLINPVIDNSEKGYGYNKVKNYWEEFSPLHNIKEGIPPTIFLCGTADKLIPVATGELFKQKIDAVGGRCEIHWYQGQPHGFYHRMFNETMFEIDKFLVSLGYLTGQATLKPDDSGSGEMLDHQLIVAVKRNDVARVTELLDEGANVNAVDSTKSNALICAVVKNNLEKVKVLVEFGADICQRNNNKKNALDVAHNRKFTEIEKYLKVKLEIK